MTIRWLLLLLLFPSACFGAEGTPDFRAVVTELSRQGDQFVAAYLPESGMDTADACPGSISIFLKAAAWKRPSACGIRH